ncbi:outer membrane beta-barrel protein [Pedobacter soli]|uniref:Outer membrane protein beta-barrel family protein n=1 Tax=Pedobacter soli TaxID=390242 RepID=A0A1G6I3Y8_9SPHI|nr:outer membrane beta-barrel protein [Pedobacter soli]SDC01083.1 Outer membrane protein beta-barrel family protein [Pedobacter soli]
MKALIIFFLAFISFTCYSQIKGSVSGMLVDSTKQSQKIAYATISIYNTTDSVLVNYKLSDSKGYFKLTSLPLNAKYRLVITAWQRNTVNKVILLNEQKPDIDLENIPLSPKLNNLNDVVIVGIRPPIIVRNDTVEFNAESFKTLPTAVVEDLFKKLPGFVVDAGGVITFNGKQVSRILVDGKDFFEGNNQIASKNLPSNIVDKVQVMDDAEVKRRNPTIFAADIPQVINLTLKKSVKQGMFGRLYAGLGPKEHYELGGITNIFRDTTQVSILAYGNNLSKSAFSLNEVQGVGGFQRAGNSSVNYNGGGFSIDNISFGGFGEGIQRPAGVGANFNTLTKSGIKINSKYFYGQLRNTIEERSNEGQILGNDTLNTLGYADNQSRVNSHNISAKITLNPTPKTQLIINPTAIISPRNYNFMQSKTVSDGSGDKVSTSEVANIRDGLNQSYKVTGDLFKNFNKAGRSLFANVTLLKRDNRDDNYNYSSILFENTPGSQLTNQFRKNNIRNFDAGFRSSFSEKLTGKLALTLSLDGNYFRNENALYTFYRNAVNQSYDIVVPNLTETVEQKGFKSNATIKLGWNINNDLSIQPAAIFGSINIINRFVSLQGFDQNFYFLNPGLNIRYKDFSISYQKSFLEPQVQYIQPIANNTDPLFVQLGTPDLKPTKNHRVFLNYMKFNMQKSISYNVALIGNLDQDGVIMARTIDAGGVQVSKPVNVNASGLTHNANINKTFRSKSSQLTLNAGYSISAFDSPIEVNNVRSKLYRYIISPNVGIRLNLHDKVEIFERYYLSYNKSDYNDSYYVDRSIASHGNDFELVVRWPKKIVFESNLNILLNNQDIPGYNNNIKIWNMGLTYLFLKNDRAQLKFSVNDILQNNARRSVLIAENSIRDIQSRNIGRYALATLSYNIQNFKPKVGGKETFFGF